MGVAVRRSPGPLVSAAIAAAGLALTTVGAVSTVGNLLGHAELADWTGYTIPGLAASVMMLIVGVLGIGIGSYRERGQQLRWFTAFVFVSLVVAGFVLWQMLAKEELRRSQAQTDLVVATVVSKLTEGRRLYVQALERMASRMEFEGGADIEAWVVDAEGYLEGYPGIRSLLYIDSDRTLVRRVSRHHPESFEVDAVRRELLDRAWDTMRFTVSGPTDLRVGGRGAILVMPYERPDGPAAVIAVVEYAALFEDFLAGVVLDYGLLVNVGDERVYSKPPDAVPGGPLITRAGTIDATGPDWQVQVWPLSATLAAARGPLPFAVLVLCLVAAGLVALAMMYSRTARLRLQDVELANRRLHRERTTSDVIWRDSQDLLCTLDRDVRFIEVSDASSRFWGYTPEELEGRSVFELMVEADRPRSEIERDRVAGGMPTAGFVTRMIHKNGEIVHVSWAATWSEELGLFVAIARDITDRMSRERELELAAERLRIAVHQTGRVVYDRNFVRGTWDWVGDSRGLLGFDAEYLAGLTRDQWYAHLHPDDASATRAVSDAVLRTGGGFSVMYRWRRDDGSYVWIEDAGGVTGNRMIGVLTDVTEQRAAEAVLEQRVADRTRELRVANAELEAFSYSVSHDLRTPLRAISGFAELLDEEYAETLGEGGRHYLKRITDGAARMGMLIDDLLTLGRVSRHDVARERVDLTTLARRVCGRLRESDPGRTVEFHIEESMTVEADPRLVEIALDNLIANAWKFTATRTPAEIEVRSVGGEFVVRDNGVGFDMAYADHLFGVFQRLHGPEEFAGTGVGLATVKRVIDRHGGSIRAEAEVGRGAAFFFRFD